MTLGRESEIGGEGERGTRGRGRGGKGKGEGRRGVSLGSLRLATP